jgi:hypothetical protein
MGHLFVAGVGMKGIVRDDHDQVFWHELHGYWRKQLLIIVVPAPTMDKDQDRMALAGVGGIDIQPGIHTGGAHSLPDDLD